jgi:hypothetical protein
MTDLARLLAEPERDAMVGLARGVTVSVTHRGSVPEPGHHDIHVRPGDGVEAHLGRFLVPCGEVGHVGHGVPGPDRRGSYGAALARQLVGEQIEVIEVNQPDKATRRRRGKTDTVDAEAAARAVLSGRASASAKAGDGPVEMVRIFKLAKASAIKSRTQAINQLKAVLVGADPQLRDSLSGLSNPTLIRRCAQLDASTPRDATTAAAYTLALLARRILELTTEIDDLNRQITDTLSTHAPQLLERNGVGPDTAAALLITAGDNPERLHSEASFAALCGVSPVEASSGKTQRRGSAKAREGSGRPRHAREADLGLTRQNRGVQVLGGLRPHRRATATARPARDARESRHRSGLVRARRCCPRRYRPPCAATVWAARSA